MSISKTSVWSLFKKAPTAADASRDGWWSQADAAADQVSTDAVQALRDASARTSLSLDERERQDEMLEGLEQAVRMAASPLPDLRTQHRVVGSEETCHAILPVALGETTQTPGKLFLTSARLILTAGQVHSWAWHRVRSITREERRVRVDVPGGGEVASIQCNTYGDAIGVIHVARRLMQVSSGDARHPRK